MNAAALAQDIRANRNKPAQLYWRGMSRTARGLKVAGTPTEKNRLWSIHTFAEATNLYLTAFRLLRRGDHMEGWCRLEDAELGFQRLALNPFVAELVPLVTARAELVALWQSTFPYKHFISPGMRYKKWECSICGKQSTPVEPCGHIVGKVYAGELCFRRVLDFEPLEVSIVTDPVQKYSVLQLDYDYSVVDYVLGHLSGPFHPWEGEWTHMRHDHANFLDRPHDGLCPCDSGLRYQECCLLTEGVRLPHFAMSVSSGPRVGPLETKLVKPRPRPKRQQGEPAVFRANLLKAGA